MSSNGVIFENLNRILDRARPSLKMVPISPYFREILNQNPRQPRNNLTKDQVVGHFLPINSTCSTNFHLVSCLFEDSRFREEHAFWCHHVVYVKSGPERSVACS